MNIYKATAKVKGFYDIPLWDITTPFPEWGVLFTWDAGLFFRGHDEHGKEIKQMSGSLIEHRFTTIEQKISYLQGILEEYGSSSSPNVLAFANSTETVERTKKWLREVALFYNSEKFKHVENQPKVLPAEELIFDPILEHNITYACPICHSLRLCSKIVEFITNYNIK